MLATQAQSRVDFGEVEMAFAQIARSRRRPVLDVMRQSARRIAFRLALYTQPYGFAAAGKAMGEAAVNRDIRRVFGTISHVFDRISPISVDAARGFWQAAKAGDIARMRAITAAFGIDLEPIRDVEPALHANARNGRGRVGNTHRSGVFVFTDGAVDRYVAHIQKRVGVSAAGWAYCAEQFGGVRSLASGEKGIPRWKRPNGRRHGGAVMVKLDPDNPRVVMENRIPWIMHVCPMVTQNRAIREESETLKREVDRALKHELRRAGFGRTGLFR
jgi:hypothetical protein